MEDNRVGYKELLVEWGTREAVDISDGGLYHKVTVSSREGCNIGSMW